MPTLKAFSIARKTLWEAWREPKLFGLLLVFPALLILIYYIAFGQSNQGIAQVLKVLILNQDTGSAGAQFVEAIHSYEFDGKPVFTTAVITDRGEAEATLKERKAALLLVIPPNFSQAMRPQEAAGSKAAPAALGMVGDTTSDNYVFASSFLTSLADAFAKQQIGWRKPDTISMDFVSGTGTLSDFQFGVPGVLVFGVMFYAISSATVLVREDTGGTLRRLKLTRANAADLLIGITMAHMVLSAVQIPIAFVTALAFGFKSPGSLPLAIGIGMVLSLTATGLGLIAACFTRSEASAANLGTVLMMPLVFLSGAMFPMPAVPLFSIGERVISLYDIMPSTQAGTALRRVLIYGDTPDAISFELVTLTILSVLYLAAGIVFYQRRRLTTLA